MSIHLSVDRSIHLPSNLRDFLKKRKRSCKTMKPPEASSLIEIDKVKNIQKRSNSARLPSKTECWAQNWRLRANAFAFFPLHVSKVLRLPGKSDARSYERAAPVTQSHLSKPEDLMLQHAAPLKRPAPWPPNMSDSCVSCTAPARRNESLQIFFNCPTPAIVSENAITFDKVQNPSRLPHKVTLELAKVLLEWDALYMLTSKCASRNNVVHFFNILTSKSALDLVFWTFWLCNALCATAAYTFSTSQRSKVAKVLRTGSDFLIFVWQFGFRICFAPQRRAPFQHLHFQKGSGPGVFWTFWLWNALRATGAGTFSTSQHPKAVRTWGVFASGFRMCFAPQPRAIFDPSPDQMSPHPPL